MNQKHYIVIGVFVLAFGAVGYLGWSMLIKPNRAKIAAKNIERDDVEKKLQEAKSKAAQYEKFRALSENIRRDLNFVLQRLNGDLGRNELYNGFTQLVNSSALYSPTLLFNKRDRSKSPGFNTLDEVPVTLAFNTDYTGLGEFMNRLVASRRVLIPMSLSISEFATTGELNTPTLKVNQMVVSVFLENGK